MGNELDSPVELYLKNDTFSDKLYKRGKFNKGWKERFFAVYRIEQKIEYYASSDDRKQNDKMCGSIDLCSVAKIEVIDDDFKSTDSSTGRLRHIGYNEKAKSEKSFTFYLITKKRTYVFAAYSKESLLKWLKYLQSCLYGQVVKQGWLSEQIGKYINHKKVYKYDKKYYVLNKFQQIKYYNNQQKTSCLGTIDLKNVKSMGSGCTGNQKMMYSTVVLRFPSGGVTLATTDKKSRDDWYDFIAIMKEPDRNHDKWEKKLQKKYGVRQVRKQNNDKIEQKELTIHKRPKDDSSDDENESKKESKSKSNTYGSYNEAMSSQLSKHTENVNKARPALYCRTCGNSHGKRGQDCVKCGKFIHTPKVFAYLCYQKCGFSLEAKKCIKCGKPTHSGGVQGYLCNSCGSGMKSKKCVKCGWPMGNNCF
eukprot:214829_1